MLQIPELSFSTSMLKIHPQSDVFIAKIEAQRERERERERYTDRTGETHREERYVLDEELACIICIAV